MLKELRAIDLGVLLFIFVLGSVIVFLFYVSSIEPNMVSDEVKSKIKILSPYDEYKFIYSSPDAFGWWYTVVTVFDVQSGGSVSSVLHYNRDTGFINGSLHGIEIIKEKMD